MTIIHIILVDYIMTVSKAPDRSVQQLQRQSTFPDYVVTKTARKTTPLPGRLAET